MDEEFKEYKPGFIPLPKDAVYCSGCKRGFDPYLETKKLHYL